MKPKREVEETIRGKLRFTAGSTLRDRLLTEIVHAQEESRQQEPARHEPVVRRIVMRSATARLASAAAVIVVVALSITLWVKVSTPAYALEQTVKALENVRFLHIIRHDEAGQIDDERWIEIGMDGWQVRYRQDNPAPREFGVIEDGNSTAVYRHDKKAVVLYDRKDVQYQWVGPLGEAFENLRQEGKVLQENVEYKGRLAHKVWWPYMSGECYVDPETKLPVAANGCELSYEEPPAGTFMITIPEGYVMADMRPGATTPIPAWLQEEVDVAQAASEKFQQATQALANGDLVEAANLFEYVTEHQAGRNWAWFWLGSSYAGQGKYDLAIAKFTKVLEMFKAYGGGGDKPLGYCNYARGLAYARLGMTAEATADLQVCLPAMVQTLRIPSSGSMFEYADNPMIRYGKYKPSDQEIVVKMVNRLRLVTGQNFGYDPAGTAEQNEAAIAAWEQWLATDGTIQFTPEAELLAVPTAQTP